MVTDSVAGIEPEAAPGRLRARAITLDTLDFGAARRSGKLRDGRRAGGRLLSTERTGSRTSHMPGSAFHRLFSAREVAPES